MLCIDERLGGDLSWYDADDELELVMRVTKLEDLRFFGEFFTWQDEREQIIMRKLDRVVINAKWIIDYASSEARFHPTVNSDHTVSCVYVAGIN